MISSPTSDPVVSPSTTPSPSTPAVWAVLLTDTSATGLSDLLDAVAAQTRTPDRVLVLDRSRGALGDSVRPTLAGAPVEVRPVGGLGLRTAVHQVAAELTEDVLLWVLPVGTHPEARTLAQLMEIRLRSSAVAMVAPKLVDHEDPQRLRSVGISATSAGRLIDLPPAGAQDQGQYDDRQDVLGVPLVGALVDASLVRDLRGWAPLADVGADLDFGWRAQRAGRRVLMAPRAQVRVSGDLGVATATDGPRRRAGLRVGLVRAPWWSLPGRALWLALASLVGSIALLLVKRPRAALSMLTDLGALEPITLIRAKLRSRGPSVVRRRDLSALFVPGDVVRGRIVDSVHDALFPTSARRDDTPAEHRVSTAKRVLTHPGLLACLAVLIVTLASARSLGTKVLAGLGGGLVGGELLGGRISGQALWHAWTDGWRGDGLGGPAVVGAPHLGLLALPTWLVEQVPGTGSLTSAGGLVVALALFLAPAAAAATAYLAGRVVTPSRWPRAAVALVWGLAGPIGPALAQGRLGPAIADVLLPAVAGGLVLLARRDGTATAAWATALATALLGAFTPVLLMPITLICLLVLVAGPTLGARLRAVVPILGTLVLLGPWWLAVWEQPRLLLAGPGALQWGGEAQHWWQLAFLQPGGPGGAAPAVAAWLLLPLGIVAVVGLVVSRGVGSVANGAAVLIVLGLLGTLAAPRITVATVPAGAAAAGAPITVWSGIPMSLALLGLLAAALGAFARPRRAEPTEPLAGGQPADRLRAARRGLSLILVGTGLAYAVGWVIATVGTELSAWHDPRPAVAIEHTDGDIAGRTLFLTPTTEGLAYHLVAREIGDVARSLPADRAQDQTLADPIADLVGGSARSADALADVGVGIVGLPEGADPGVRRSLDATEGMTRLMARDGWDYWRIATPGAAEHRPVAPPRLALSTNAGASAIVTSGQHGATETTISTTEETTLTVAETESWARHAVVRLDGEEITAASSTTRPSYRVPAGEHELTISLNDSTVLWRRLQLLAAAAVLFLAVPFGSRASRRTR